MMAMAKEKQLWTGRVLIRHRTMQDGSRIVIDEEGLKTATFTKEEWERVLESEKKNP